MISYQVLCTVPNDIEKEWRDWMLQEHIHDVMNTEMFSSYSLNRVLKPESENARQYCIEYFTDSYEKYEQYRKDFAPVLQAASNSKFGNAITVSRMVMESIDS